MIYHLLPELEPFSAATGGALARDVANIMRYSTTDMVVCLSQDGTWGHDASRAIIAPGLRTYNRIRGRRFFPIWMIGPMLRAAFQPLLSRLKRGDIVWNHNQLVFSAALGSAIKAKGVKLVHHFHDGHVPYGTINALRSFTPDASIFVSEYLKQHWLKVFPSLANKKYAIPNGADDALFHPLPYGAAVANSPPVILYVGRLQPEKGVHVLIDAMRKLQERKVDVLCKVFGSAFSSGSKPTEYIKNLLENSPSNVSFEGHRSGKLIAEEFRKADIFCCPSIWQEPFGNVNIEAMASGVPVIAASVGGITEVAEGGGVLLVEPNSAVGIADAAQKLLQNKELRAKVAAEGLSSFRRKYTWSAVCNEYDHVMQSL